MTTEVIGVMFACGRCYIRGCGKSTWISQETGQQYQDELKKLDPRWTAEPTMSVFEVEERAAQEFIARVMAEAPAVGVMPMMNDRRRHRMPE